MLKLKKITPSLMVYGELGKTPLEIEINTRMLSFWSRILDSNKNKLSHLLYKLIYKLHVNNIYHSQWVLCIKKLLIEIGEPSLWEKQEVLNTRHFKALCKTKLKDLYIQNWFTLLKESKCCANYRSLNNLSTLKNILQSFQQNTLSLSANLEHVTITFLSITTLNPIKAASCVTTPVQLTNSTSYLNANSSKTPARTCYITTSLEIQTP